MQAVFEVTVANELNYYESGQRAAIVRPLWASHDVGYAPPTMARRPPPWSPSYHGPSHLTPPRARPGTPVCTILTGCLPFLVAVIWKHTIPDIIRGIRERKLGLLFTFFE